MEELIARGGTAGLILALLIAVGYLIRLLIQYINAYISDLKTQIASWTDKTDRALSVAEQAVIENKRLADAIETRNRLEEQQINEARIRREARRGKQATE